MLCDIFKSARDEGLYLFVSQHEALRRVPGALLDRFGEPRKIMTLNLTPDKKLARNNTADVLASLHDRGYYLQMPPTRDAEMLAIDSLNEKLPR